MAQRLGGGWEVHGLDNHGAALERGRALARGSGMKVTFSELDIRKGGMGALSERPIGMVHGCRFLHRPLFEALPNLLAPGVCAGDAASGSHARARCCGTRLTPSSRRHFSARPRPLACPGARQVPSSCIPTSSTRSMARRWLRRSGRAAGCNAASCAT